MVRLKITKAPKELEQLNDQLQGFKREYSLLKDRKKKMMEQFSFLVKENHSLRMTIEKNLSEVVANFELSNFLEANLFTDELVLTPTTKGFLASIEKSIHVIEIIMRTSKNDQTIFEMSVSLEYLNEVTELEIFYRKTTPIISEYLKLTEVEKKCQTMATEIEELRKRLAELVCLKISRLENDIHSDIPDRKHV